MTEKDLDIAIEKCERIMEFDTRTLKDPESENGWIFEKVYDLLKFLRRCQFDSDAKGGDMISRQAVIDALTEDKEMINAGLDSLTLDYNTRRNEELRREQIDEDIETIKDLPSAQPQYEELTPEEAASEIASGSTMSTWYWLDDMIRLNQMGYAICRKR